MMETLNDFFATLSGYLWGWPMIILLLGTHIFLTFRLGVPQRKLLTAIRLSVSRDKGSTGDVSQFGALATALAATIGTGNIVGVDIGARDFLPPRKFARKRALARTIWPGENHHARFFRRNTSHASPPICASGAGAGVTTSS